MKLIIMDKKPNGFLEKLNARKIKRSCHILLIHIIRIRIRNIPCNWPAGPYFNNKYTSLYALIRTCY